METQLYYFSGTGNSLFLARELRKRLPDVELLPVVSLMSRERIVSTGRNIGFVFPVHALTIPIIMKKFLKKLDAGSAAYIFAVANRYGTVFYGFKEIDRLLRKQGKRLDAEFMLDMCNNDTRHGRYDTPPAEEIAAIEKTALEKLDIFAGIIRGRGRHEEDIREHTVKSAANPVAAFLTDRLVLAMTRAAAHTKGVNYYYVDGNCTGCGMCEKICLSGKISMSGGKPSWDKNTVCSMCFACLNFCPRKAVQIHSIPGVKSYSEVNGRYPHPYADVADTVYQKGGPG